MDGINAKDDTEAIDDDRTPPVTESSAPATAFHNFSASLPVVPETERHGEDGEQAKQDSAPVAGKAGGDRPPVHPLPMSKDDHAIPSARSGGAVTRSVTARHRRSQSEDPLRGPKSSNSFQTFKSQIQRAWNWGGNPQEKDRHFFFNPEELANQKRQWYQLQAKSLDRTKYEEPTALFEHLIVTGLPPDANLEAVEQAFARKKKWESAMARTLVVGVKHEYWFPSPAPLEPQMLFKYPPGKKLPMRSKDICAFCFPGGVKACMVERTPSLSDLNELVYGQGHLGRDDTAFVFSLKVADNASLYGVCLLVPEIVQRPPGILGGSSPFCHHAASRFLVSAPRCYCLLTRVPFFKLHFEMLNSIVSQERLDRVTQFVNEVYLTDRTASNKRSPDHFNGVADSPFRNCITDWMSSAIPVDSAVLLSASAAGIITEEEASSVKPEKNQSLPRAVASESSFGRAKETNKDERINSHCSDGHESGLSSPGFSLPSHSSNPNFVRSASSISLFSSARCQEDDDECFLTSESDLSGEISTMDLEKESRGDFMKIVCAYNALPIPARGSEIVFHPLEHYNTIQYRRPAVSDLCLVMNFPELGFQDPSALAEVSAKLAAAEEAVALSMWTIATICRAVTLDNVTFFMLLLACYYMVYFSPCNFFLQSRLLGSESAPLLFIITSFNVAASSPQLLSLYYLGLNGRKKGLKTAKKKMMFQLKYDISELGRFWLWLLGCCWKNKWL